MAGDFRCETIDPDDPDGPKTAVIFPAFLTMAYYKYHPVRYENLRAAKWVLEHPLRIFRGVREYNEPDWLCYVGKPREWYIKENTKEPFPEDKLFAVYVNSRKCVYECRGEIAAKDDSLCPDDWENRYGELIWKSTS